MIRLMSVLLTVLVLCGCARRGIAPLGAEKPVTQPVDPNTEKAFDQVAAEIAPPPARPPATGPAAPPPLQAIELYARARDALHRRDDFSAVDLLERALTFDPQSAELHYALGRAYLQRGGSTDRAAQLLEQAAELNPDSFDAWLDLARLYLRSTPARAMRPLILATRCPDFEARDADAAVVEFHLARLLQQAGYDRAACEQYESFLRRLGRRAATRTNADLAALAAHPEPVQMELARLYEKRRQFDRAIAMYERLAAGAPDAFEPRARVVRALLAAGRMQQAMQQAGDLVRQFRASPASVDLLLEAYRRAGDESRAVAELTRLHRKDPDDRSLLVALADALSRIGRPADAQKLLTSALRRKPGDLDLLRRLLTLQRDDPRGAALTLIEESVRRPAGVSELSPFWRPLLAGWRDNALRADDLRGLALSRELESARLYWMSRLAAEVGRDRHSRQLMRQATEVAPVFPPALAMRLQQIWVTRDATAEQKAADSEAMIQLAEKRLGAAAGLQLRAVQAHYEKETPNDLPAFETATAAGELSADVALLYAQSLLRATRTADYERVMWKLLSDFPGFEEAYLQLFAYYNRNQQAGPAMKVLDTWRRADPGSVAARLAYGHVLLAGRAFGPAEAAIQDLLRDAADDPQVLQLVSNFATESDRRQFAVDEFERLRSRDPLNGAVILALVQWHVSQGDTPAALRALRAAVEPAAGHANLLYFIASVYNQLDEQSEAERVLQLALAADPKHVPASNDLAYFWSDQGRNLTDAERMARHAVDTEPDNSAYLDTLGWVLYKQNRLTEARTYLQQAVDAASPVDPVLLDHLADTHYRLGEEAEAAALWVRAKDLLATMRTDRQEHVELSRRLDIKLRQRSTGEPVEVAPLAITAGAADSTRR